jgi:hypothetical protein
LTGGTIDRTGMAAFLHIIRAPGDPERRQRASERDEKDTQIWRRLFRSGSQAEWSDALHRHLADGIPRTFNRMMVELCDMTADVALDKAPDLALWALVAAGEVEHTASRPVYFRALPPCAISMHCLCAGHARGAPPSAACDTSEAP